MKQSLKMECLRTSECARGEKCMAEATSSDRLSRAWAEQRPAYGCWITGPSFNAPNAFLRAGLDYLGIDCQHSFLHEADAARIANDLQHADIAVVVRVSTLSVPLIGRVLDAGTDAVIVPMISTPDEAALAVSATRYMPRGVRSFGPVNPKLGLDPLTIEARSRVFAMIETAEAMQNLDAICATPGLTGVYVGPADLALGLGEPGIAATPPVLEAIERIAKAAAAAGIIAGIHANGGAKAQEYGAMGFRLLTMRSESQILVAGATEDLAVARGSAPPPAGRPTAGY
jgi:2-keto-3-deoxy-L-rhamnonate aldolase RhmA